MKVIIQIPCLNEAMTLPETVADLPREIKGADTVEFLIIDDGSSDGTSEVARDLGVHHIVRFPKNRGLARAFMAGVDACLRLGADVIVNTDADNQYNGGDIEALVQPVLAGEADLVVGDRQVQSVAHFSATKKKFQKLGSWVVRLASGTTVPDAPSGFRAISRETALRLFVVGDFSYTIETLIQAGRAGLHVTSVPVKTNPKTRESRLFRGIFQYMRRTGSTIIRAYTMVRPLSTFFFLAAVLGVLGTILGGRFVYYYLTEPGNSGHIQSLILVAILLLSSVMTAVTGLLADLVGANRKMLEDVVLRLRRVEYDGVVLQDPAKEGIASPGALGPKSSSTAAGFSLAESPVPHSPSK